MPVLSPLWSAIEMFPTLRAVESEWNERLRGCWPEVQTFFRRTGEQARSFPRSHGQCPYEVVEREDGSFVGVGHEFGDTRELAVSDLMVWEFQTSVLANRLANVWGFSTTAKPWDGDFRGVVEIGHTRGEESFRFLLFVPHATRETLSLVQRLILEHHHPFVLCVPTEGLISAEARSQASQYRSTILALDDLMEIGAGGLLRPVRPFDQITRHIAIQQTCPITPRPRENEFRKERNFWCVTYRGRSDPIPDSIGMKYLSLLLQAKPKGLPVQKLISQAQGILLPETDSADDVLDPQSQRCIAERLRTLGNQLDDAIECGNVEAIAAFHQQIEDLKNHRAGTRGLAGRNRKLNSRLEISRVSVQKAITRAIERLPNLELVSHLKAAIRTGNHCCYQPSPDIDWIT